MAESLSPHALGTVADLLRHLKRDSSASEQDQERCILSGNEAVGWMERRTARRLRARTYRNSETITGTWSSGGTSISGSGFTSTVKVLDQMLAAGLQPGTRADVVAASTITISEPATAAGSGVSITVGSEPLVADGTGSPLLWIAETPVIEVYGAAYRDATGASTSIDLTGARLVSETGKYVLMNDAFPSGTLNIEIECAAGYRPPSATVAWNEDWQNLRRLWLRVAEIIYQDSDQLMGRRDSRRLAQSDVTIGWKMPEDVEVGIEAYARKP